MDDIQHCFGKEVGDLRAQELTEILHKLEAHYEEAQLLPALEQEFARQYLLKARDEWQNQTFPSMKRNYHPNCANLWSVADKMNQFLEKALSATAWPSQAATGSKIGGGTLAPFAATLDKTAAPAETHQDHREPLNYQDSSNDQRLHLGLALALTDAIPAITDFVSKCLSDPPDRRIFTFLDIVVAYQITNERREKSSIEKELKTIFSTNPNTNAADLTRLQSAIGITVIDVQSPRHPRRIPAPEPTPQPTPIRKELTDDNIIGEIE